MILLIAMAVGQSDPPTPIVQDLRVHQPEIACWVGYRTFTPATETTSETVVFRTEGDEQPLSIKHNRDLILEHGQVVQNYNFIDYHFANGANSLAARTYLDEPDVVSIHFLGEDQPKSVNDARALISASVLCYFQKRFRKIDVLTEAGYERLWSIK